MRVSHKRKKRHGNFCNGIKAVAAIVPAFWQYASGQRAKSGPCPACCEGWAQPADELGRLRLGDFVGTGNQGLRNLKMLSG
jgi:hypothetical protein